MIIGSVKSVKVTCDLCGRSNEDLHCATESFGVWRRLSVRHFDCDKDGRPVVEYCSGEYLSNDHQVCPMCNLLVSDLMDRKRLWVKIVREKP